MSDEVKLLPCPLRDALTDARNNILSLLGAFRDEMPPVAVKLFQAQAKQIDEAIAAWNTRAIEATRPPIGTDEVVERVANTNRKCLSCGFIVEAWPNIMTCRCRAIPWVAVADGDAFALVSSSIRPILRGCIDPHTKDDFEGWVDRLTNDAARAAIAAMKDAASD